MATARLAFTSLSLVLIAFGLVWVELLGITVSTRDVALGMMFLVGTFFGIMASWHHGVVGVANPRVAK